MKKYKATDELHILQEILSSNPFNGDYKPALDELLDLSKEKEIRKHIFSMSDESFTICEKLQEEGFINLEHLEQNKYKVTLTKDGVVFLIRDRLEQLRRFDELNDECIQVYLSKIKIEGVNCD